MPALIDLRRRIKSVRNTQKITQAMKSVATAKFKQAQNRILSGRHVWHARPDFLGRIAPIALSPVHPLLDVRAELRVTLFVISSDKGLCGAFNSNLLNHARSWLGKKADKSEVELLLAGKKAAAFFQGQPFPIARTFPTEVLKYTTSDYKDLADAIIRLYTKQQTDAVYVAYNEFKSILAPKVTLTRLLPIMGDRHLFIKDNFSAEPNPESANEKANSSTPLPNNQPEKYELKKRSLSPIFEPGEGRLLEKLVPHYILEQVIHFFSESVAAEHAARMMSMDNATKNADELIEKLTLVLNKVRQAMITTELLEIQSAVEALRDD